MSSLDADVNIILNAEDRASPEVQNAVKNMNASWRDHLNQTRAVTRQYELQNKTLFTSARAIQSLGSITSRVLSIYNSFTLTQIRLADAARNVADAMTDENEARARYGPGSPEEIKARERTTQQLKDQAAAADQAKLAYAFMAISIIADSTRIFTTVIPKMLALTRVLKGITAATGVGALSAVAGLGAKKGGGLASKFAGRGLGLAAGATGVGLALGVISDIQPANEDPDNPLPSGLDAVKPLVTQIYNFFGTTTENLLKEVQKASKGYVTFGQ